MTEQIPLKPILRIAALVISSPIWLSVAAVLAVLLIVFGVPIFTFATLLCCMDFAITGHWANRRGNTFKRPDRLIKPGEPNKSTTSKQAHRC